MRVHVEDGAVVERLYVGSGQPVSDVAGQAFPAVEGLFELVASAIDRDAHALRVTYDPDLGVPIDIWIDYLEAAVDEELGAHVTEEVSPLP